MSCLEYDVIDPNLWHKYKRRGDNGIHRSCPLLTLTYDIVLLSLRVHTSGFWCKCYFSCLVIETHYAIGEFFKEKELRTTVVSYYCIVFIVLGDGVIYWAIIAHSLLFCSLPRFFWNSRKGSAQVSRDGVIAGLGINDVLVCELQNVLWCNGLLF